MRLTMKRKPASTGSDGGIRRRTDNRCFGLIASALAIAFAAHASANDSSWMSAEALRRAFSGTTISGVYGNGLAFREQYRTDGTLTYVEPSNRRDGNWSVVAGTFCTIYTGSDTGGCYRVTRVSDNCFHFYFAARSVSGVKGGATRALSYTAEAWRTDRTATCKEVPSS